MSTLYVDSIQPKTTGQRITIASNYQVGAVLQVKQSILTTTWASSASSTAFEDTPLSVTITPQSTNSKILITGYINNGGLQASHYDFKIVKNGADFLLSTDSGIGSRTKSHIHHYIETSVNAYNIFADNINLLDSPSSTSALTYTLQAGTPHSAAYVAYLNRSSRTDNAAWNAYMVSTLTATEIGG